MPTVFGVIEDDLLFALPVEGIRDHVVKGPFPAWKELVAECREATGQGASDSVNWKSFALGVMTWISPRAMASDELSMNSISRVCQCRRSRRLSTRSSNGQGQIDLDGARK